MQIRVTPEQAMLCELENVRALGVHAPVAMPLADIDAALASAGLGRVTPGGTHAWVPIAALRALAVVPHGCTSEEFDAMVTFAASHEWVEGAEIRAHIERHEPLATPDTQSD